MKIATLADFKTGTTLITSEGFEFTLTDKYDVGVWESRSNRGSKCIFESEARFYKVKS